MDGHVHLAQRVHELRCREEVRLVGGQDVSARIAIRRTAQVLGKEARRSRLGAETAATTTAATLACTARSRALTLDSSVERVDVVRRHGPRVPTATLDGVLPHLVDVEQEVLTPLRRDVEYRVVRRDG